MKKRYGFRRKPEKQKQFDPDATQELPVPEVVKLPGGGEMVFLERTIEEVTSQPPSHNHASHSKK